MDMKIKGPLLNHHESAEGLDILELVSVLFSHKWKIIITTAICVFFCALFAIVKTPVYSASALIQVEKNSPDSILSHLNEYFQSGGSSSPASTEIGLVRSRMVVGKTIDDLHLRIRTKEKGFPAFRRLKMLFSDRPPNAINITDLEMPEKLVCEIKIISAQDYTFSCPNGIRFNGNLHKAVAQKNISLTVEEIDAQPGTIFQVNKVSQYQATNSLIKQLSVNETPKDSGLLQLTITGEKPELLVKILNTIGINYLQQNVTRLSEEKARSLAFVDNILPSVKSQLHEAESKLKAFQKQNESIDLSLEGKSVLDNAVELQAQENTLKFQKTEISKRYTKDHPEYRSLLEKEALLNKEKAKINKFINNMPAKQQTFVNLRRDVESSQQIYIQLLTKQQEFSIAKASTIGSVRIVDSAEADPIPVSPKKKIIVILGMFVGLFLSCGYILIRHFINTPVDNAETLETLGMEVLGVIPESKILKQQSSYSWRTRSRKASYWLAKNKPTDLAIEAIRSLRTGLSVALAQSGKKTIMFSSATPGSGKSFISSNLATVMANLDKKVLLIDCDMRLGYLHELMQLQSAPGLSDFLKENVDIDRVVQETSIEGLSVITRGSDVSSPAELLASSGFEKLINWAEENFDYIILDTPPILAVTDAAIVSKLAGLSLLVARYRKNSIHEVVTSMRRFHRSQVELNGFILNGIVNNGRNTIEYGDYGYAGKGELSR